MSDVAFWGSGSDPAIEPFRQALRAEWERRGYEFVEGRDPDRLEVRHVRQIDRAFRNVGHRDTRE